MMLGIAEEREGRLRAASLEYREAFALASSAASPWGSCSRRCGEEAIA